MLGVSGKEIIDNSIKGGSPITYQNCILTGEGQRRDPEFDGKAH